MMPRLHLLACTLALALSQAALAATPDQPVDELAQVSTKDEWVMHGGNVQLRFNIDRLAAQGVHVASGAQDKADTPDWAAEIEFPLLHGGGLRFAAPGGNFEQFIGGQVTGRDGFKLRTEAGLETGGDLLYSVER